MAQTVCNMTLDVSVIDGCQVMKAKQGDSMSRVLCVQITDQKKPLSLEGHVGVMLNVFDGTDRYSFAGKVVDGEARFALPQIALAKAGAVLCDVSILDGSGGRLTTESFQLLVEEAACPENAFGGEESMDPVTELLAQNAILPLAPTVAAGGMTLAPALNRRYAVDLSPSYCKQNGEWLPLTLELPWPEDPATEHWILLYCHAPIDGEAGALVVDWGQNQRRLFENGEIPYITTDNFDIVCTYSPILEKWMIGVCQYAACEEGV